LAAILSPGIDDGMIIDIGEGMVINQEREQYRRNIYIHIRFVLLTFNGNVGDDMINRLNEL
jgi:hypothetical protein